MTEASLHELCLSHSGAVKEFPFGRDTAVFKVLGKIFAINGLSTEPLTVSLKCEPELAEQLRAAHPEITAGYHLNKRHWNTVTLNRSLAESMVIDMVEDSHDLVVASLPRAKREALGWTGGPSSPPT